jgi:hypothetical protein
VDGRDEPGHDDMDGSPPTAVGINGFILRDASLRDAPREEDFFPRMGCQTLMVRSRALRGVSNHEAAGEATAIRANSLRCARDNANSGFKIEHQDARLRDISLGAFLSLCAERIEIDQLRIVVIGVAMEPSAAVYEHQGLHTPGIQIVDMLVPQRDWQ